MPSIFNEHSDKKFRDIANAAASAGEDTVGKAVAKGIHIGYKTIIAIAIGCVAIVGFIFGSLNIAKHLEVKK
jgi:hypothetical protein